MSPISLIIADDHPIFSQGLRMILEADHRCEVLGTATNGVEALKMAAELKPLILILDVSMPEKDGLDVASERQENDLPFEVILLTMHDDRETFKRAMSLGVKGYVLKDDASADIVRGVKAVAQGKIHVSPGVAHHLLDSSPVKKASSIQSELSALTAAELRILRLISRDMISKEIADELGISPKTVDNHRGNICTKLGLFGSHSLTRYAIEHKDELEQSDS